MCNDPIIVSSSLMGQKNIVIRMLNAVLANLHAEGERILPDDDIEHFYNCKVQVN